MQSSLFGQTHGGAYRATEAARIDTRELASPGDPATSALAAEGLRDSPALSRELSLIVRAMGEHPGLTTADLWPHTGLDRFTVAKRMSMLERRGLARRGESATSASTGKLGETWWPTSAAKGVA